MPDVFVDPARALIGVPPKATSPDLYRENRRSSRIILELENFLVSHGAVGWLPDWFESLGDEASFWPSQDAGLDPRMRPVIPRLALALHRHRRDVQERYPAPLGKSRRAFAIWYATHAAREYRLPESAVAPVLASMPLRDRLRVEAWRLLKGRRRRRTAPRPKKPAESASATSAPPETAPWLPGVQVAGYLEASSREGQHARGTVKALQAAGFPNCSWNLGENGHGPAENGGRPADLQCLLLHVNAEAMPAVRLNLPAPLRRTPLKIGYWNWDLSYFPLSLFKGFEGLAEVWAPSRFCRAAFATLSPVPVRCVPPCVVAPAAAAFHRSALGVPEDAIVFLSAVDLLSVPRRKNPEGLIEAFAMLQRRTGQKTHLLIKVEDSDRERLAALRNLAEGLPVTFLTQFRPGSEWSALISGCDCFLSLHRSEGIGLALIEAMLLGKPVIATGYGGSKDYLDEETGWPVEFRLRHVGPDAQPYPEMAVWAEPDLEHAAACMLEVVRDAASVARKTQTAGRRVRRIYSPEAAGARLVRELERLTGSPPTPSMPEANPHHDHIPVDSLQEGN